jgi:hypothetical protein
MVAYPWLVMCSAIHNQPDTPLACQTPLSVIALAQMVGWLIVTHHRLPISADLLYQRDAEKNKDFSKTYDFEMLKRRELIAKVAYPA